MFSRILRRTSRNPFFSILHRSHLLPSIPPPPPITPPPVNHFPSIPFSSSSSSYNSSTNLHGDADLHSDTEGVDNGDHVDPQSTAHQLDDEMLRDVAVIITSVADFSTDAAAAKRRLEQCGVVPSPELVAEVLSRLRNDWAAAFTFFLWAGYGSHQGYAHSVREYHCMIAILAKMRRFDTAWTLVGEMKGSSLVTHQTLMILIRRYAAVHDVAKAIDTFYALKRFGFSPSIEDFHGLLSALCRYKNVEDAEHLLLCNEKAFPFDTKSFNIILNGWCSVLVHLREAKRFWKDMDRRGIAKDVVSYGSMISCYSKAGNLNDVLKLFDRMKVAGVLPDRKVYNAVIYALAKGKCMDEAKRLVKTMEEKCVSPNAVTFNSLIRPLCKARRIDDARLLFDEMWQRGISASIRTYHSFFDVLRTEDEVFKLLDRMKRTGCQPVLDRIT
ncbi:hypothetical protein J5N97_017519 [Dioscorea zingiberensis]|uniref:Pentatricopeptide repeat-containing protein n=1 Tax=Dioscorea zingiberensis TaxID=325984 RepID=A0A9D5CM67_9LILI|nr:hypothetical protein J5N97_017519 [Dioscorea zingiberensis]